MFFPNAFLIFPAIVAKTNLKKSQNWNNLLKII